MEVRVPEVDRRRFDRDWCWWEGGREESDDRTDSSEGAREREGERGERGTEAGGCCSCDNIVESQ